MDVISAEPLLGGIKRNCLIKIVFQKGLEPIYLQKDLSLTINILRNRPEELGINASVDLSNETPEIKIFGDFTREELFFLLMGLNENFKNEVPF